MEETIGVLGVKLAEVFQVFDGLVTQMLGGICNNMKIVVSTLVHNQLFS
jgi:hypothetical protein